MKKQRFFLIFSSLFSYIGYLDNLSRKIFKHIIKLQQMSFSPPFYILHLLLESLKPKTTVISNGQQLSNAHLQPPGLWVAVQFVESTSWGKHR